MSGHPADRYPVIGNSGVQLESVSQAFQALGQLEAASSIGATGTGIQRDRASGTDGGPWASAVAARSYGIAGGIVLQALVHSGYFGITGSAMLDPDLPGIGSTGVRASAAIQKNGQ